MRFARKALTLAIAASLTACGGGGGGVSAPTGTPLSGLVADGYLVGATACLDLNRNKACDSEEPSAVTTSGGAYTLTIPDGVDSTLYPIVVEVTTATIDEDTGETVSAGYVLTAPAGKHQFVSPLTTMVQTKLERNPVLKAEEAEQQVKDALGVQASLFEDYVQKKQDSADTAATDYKKLHNIAQVVARTMGAQITSLEASLGTTLTAEQTAALKTVIVEAIVQGLSTIVTYVEINTTDDGSIKQDALKIIEDPNDVTVDSSLINGTVSLSIRTSADQLSKESEALTAAAAAESVTAATMEATLKGGLHWFDAHEEYNSDTQQHALVLEYEKISVDNAGALQFTEYEYNTQTNTFVAEEDDTWRFQLLTENGWVVLSDDQETISFNDDGSATLSQGNVVSEEIRVTLSNVEGKLIRNLLSPDYADLVSESATFTSGAKAMSFIFKSLADRYEIGIWDGCDKQALAGADNPCNYVWSNAVNGPLSSLDQLHQPDVYVQVGENNYVQFQSDGTLQVGTVEFSTKGPVFTAGTGPTGTWEERTVHGKTLVLFTLPDSVETWGGDDRDYTPFFTVEGGYVRQGEFFAAGTADVEDGFGFNSVAAEDIKAALLAGPDSEGSNESQIGTGTQDSSGSTAVSGTNNELTGTAWHIFNAPENEHNIYVFDTSTSFTEHFDGNYRGELSGFWDLSASSLSMKWNSGETFEGNIDLLENGSLKVIGTSVDYGIKEAIDVTLSRISGFTSQELLGTWQATPEVGCTETISFASNGTGQFTSSPGCLDGAGSTGFGWYINQDSLLVATFPGEGPEYIGKLSASGSKAEVVILMADGDIETESLIKLQ